MATSRRYEIGVGCLLLVAFGLLVFIALQIGALRGFGARTDVTVLVPDAAGLQPGAVVSIAGVQIGEVQSLRIVDGQAEVALGLDPEAPVHVDALVRIRARSVLGEKYAAIEPQGDAARRVRDGDVLQAAGRQIEIDELVTAIAGLVDAVDAEAVKAAVARLSAALDADPDRLTRLLENADVLIARGAEASEGLPAAVDEGRATLRDARATLREIDARAAEAEGVLARVDGLVAHADAALEPVPELLVEVRSAVGDGRGVLASFADHEDEIATILSNLAEIDKVELRRLLREEGIVVRMRAREVTEERPEPWSPKGQTKPRKR